MSYEALLCFQIQLVANSIISWLDRRPRTGMNENQASTVDKYRWDVEEQGSIYPSKFWEKTNDLSNPKRNIFQAVVGLFKGHFHSVPQYFR